MARAKSRRIQRLVEVVNFDDFTDGGSTAGTLSLTSTIPANCVVTGWKAVVSTGFSGDTSATLLVGISGNTDLYTYNETGVNIFTAATYGAFCDYQGSGDVPFSSSARTVLLTLTSASDFTNVAAGKMALYISYVEL